MSGKSRKHVLLRVYCHDKGSATVLNEGNKVHTLTPPLCRGGLREIILNGFSSLRAHIMPTHP